MEKNICQLISTRLKLPLKAVTNTCQLLGEGSTIPFISRYRKEMTGSLNEVDVSAINKELQLIDALIKRKATILKSIKDQDLLTPSLKNKIDNCWESTILEDIYLPFKKKVKTKATIAKENGLEPLANIILQQRNRDVFNEAQRFINKKVVSQEDALQGARYILAEWLNENEKHRSYLRHTFEKHAIVQSRVIKSKKKEASKFEMYFEYEERLHKIPSHRLLAIFRGENEKLLRVKLLIDDERAQENIERTVINNLNSQEGQQIKLAIGDSLKRLLLPSLENEFRKKSKLKADKEAIEVFSKNLKELLLAPPLGNKSILALDPGFKSGCKLTVLDNVGALIHDETIYPHPPQSQKNESIYSLKHLIDKFNVEAVAIGNGTAGKETYKLFEDIKMDPPLDIFFVNESGASIYSASEIARQEFPDKDITVRGSASIGRRLMDPLAELVKIDPKSIGVGQYQHDVNQALLKENLDLTISLCVNAVGVNLNTASEYLLSHISGLGPVTAKNIVKFRNENGFFNERKELQKVPRMGKKAFEQCAGFLRIKNGTNPLDNTSVHPERYSLVKKMAKDQKAKIESLISDKSIQKQIDIRKYVDTSIGIPTLQDILIELEKPGLDPRGHAEPMQFSNRINTIDDLSQGMILPGVVNNVTKFGAFVDIGIKESGLVHISEITNRFISDPAEILSVNQKVNVKVILIDNDKKRVSLSIKQV